MNILKIIVTWYLKAMKIFLFLVKLSVIPIILLIILSYSSIVPEYIYSKYNYDFSHNRKNVISCNGIGSCMNDIRWEKDDLIINGTFGWSAGYEILPNSIVGFYKVKDDNINIHIAISDNNLGMLELVKRAKALAYDDAVNFEFTIKDLPKKDYKVILNNFEEWNFSVDGEKEILYKNFCKNDKSYKSDGCWRYVARKTGDIELCFNMSHYYQNESGDNYIENCIIPIVSKKEHIKYCFDKEFQKSDAKDACLEKLGKKLNEESICDMIQDYGKQAECFQHVAAVLGDIKICEKIDPCHSKYHLKDVGMVCNRYRQESCFCGVARKTQDLEVCNRISKGSIYRDYCFSAVAEEKEDIKICEEIEYHAIRDKCIKDLSF